MSCFILDLKLSNCSVHCSKLKLLFSCSKEHCKSSHSCKAEGSHRDGNSGPHVGCVIFLYLDGTTFPIVENVRDAASTLENPSHVPKVSGYISFAISTILPSVVGPASPLRRSTSS